VHAVIVTASKFYALLHRILLYCRISGGHFNLNLKYRIPIPISRYFEISMPNTEPTLKIPKNTGKPTPTSNTDTNTTGSYATSFPHTLVQSCTLYGNAMLIIRQLHIATTHTPS